LKETRPAKWVSDIRATILLIPRGKVSTYAAVAEAAGYPGYHRQVAQVLNRSGHGLPWHRVLGAGGQIKTSLETAFDQRTRLELEGVKFKGRRADMAAHAHQFPARRTQLPVTAAQQ
jgi:methylated-DNA-protein-cysteine methyltransferase-like protein